MAPVSKSQLATTPFEALFEAPLDAIQANLGHYLSNDILHPSNMPNIQGPDTFWDAMRYSVLDSGKRIRPLLLLEVCRSCGGEESLALPTACALEMIHTQSLIHDDLPCMDNDDLRRGKPTLHKAYNESTAVLVGDALIAYAFGIIARETPVKAPVTQEIILDVIQNFASVSSTQGLVNGQFVDIYYENKPFDLPVVNYIHRYKTGALFQFAAFAGARLAGANYQTVESFRTFGIDLGLAFQIVDDLLDIESTADTLGKTAGKDRAQNKATYPELLGLAASRDQANRLFDSCYQLLINIHSGSLPGGVDRLKAMIEYLRIRIH